MRLLETRDWCTHICVPGIQLWMHLWHLGKAGRKLFSTVANGWIPKSPKRQVAFKHLNKGEGSIHNLLLKVLLTHLSKSLPRGIVHTALVPVPPGLPPSLTPLYPRSICWAKSWPSPCPTECLRAPNDHYPSHYFPSGWLVAIKVIYTVRYKHVFVISFAV